MALHGVAFDSSVANGAVFLQDNAIADVFTNIQSNNVVISDLPLILGASMFGLNAQRLQLRSPTLQQVFNADIHPVRVGALAANIIPNWFDLSKDNLLLKSSEQLSAFVIQGNAGAQREYVLVLLADKKPDPVDGACFTIRFTGTTTLVADTWTQVPLTAEQNLQVGTYSVIGARGKSATGVYGRLGTPGFAWRPPFLIGSDDAWPDEPLFRRGNLGVWFQFKNTQVLTADFLATGADTTESVEVDVIFTPSA
jgi:hypothetical protein